MGTTKFSEKKGMHVKKKSKKLIENLPKNGTQTTSKMKTKRSVQRKSLWILLPQMKNCDKNLTMVKIHWIQKNNVEEVIHSKMVKDSFSEEIRLEVEVFLEEAAAIALNSILINFLQILPLFCVYFSHVSF